MKKIAVLAAAVLVPLIPAAPAQAAGHVICVGNPVGTCDEHQPTIQDALGVAVSDGQADTVLIGPGTYTDGPYFLDGGTDNALTVQGSGQGTTVLTLPANVLSQTYLQAYKATVKDLTVALDPTSSSNDHGISLSNAAAEHVTVSGPTTTNAEGVVMSGISHLDSSTVILALDTGGTGVYGDGGVVVQDTAITADYGYSHSGTGTPDTLSRLFITARSRGVVTDSGEVDIDDSVVDLGTAADAYGLVAANFNDSVATKTIVADHVTIVGGGAGSRGVWADATRLTALQHSDITLTNSIIRGPQTDIALGATNDGSQGGTSTATVTVTYTDWSTLANYNGPNGSSQLLDETGDLDIDPMFVDAAHGNYRLRSGSPVIDKGDPATGGPDTDLGGGPRVYDGDGDLAATRDMGAYERSDLVAPNTTVTAGPSGATRDITPTFAFGASEPGTSFECKLDAGSYGACSTPYTTGALANGTHTLSVRATDLSGNTDATAAVRTFRVDTVAPDTRLTSKPARHVTKKRVTFRFASTEPGSTFQCKIDRKPWRSCTSPKRVRVKVGWHKFRVRAIDRAGNVDATPAKFRFKRG